DPAVLSGTSRTDGEVFISGESFYVDSGYQADGHWQVAASRLNPAPGFTGDGTVFSLNYVVVGAGSSTITCEALAANIDGQKLELTVSGAVFYAEGVPAETSTPEPTAEPTAVPPTPTELPTHTATPVPVVETPAPVPGSVSGVVAYQDGGDAAGITVMLVSGQSVVGGVVTTADGMYTFSGITPGEYLLLADAPGYLAVAQMVQVVAEQGTSAPTMVLLAGDTDDNQMIDLADAGFIGANFGLDTGVAPPNADLNTDGTVNIVDLTLVGGNFGKSGPVMQP
ncbi:MAG: carboxypeptidase regulatory-like domain-containing protein, partial [Anaerolineae bacterium]|nr:carboxypeptidase regulatory-like domain-containing protein [Anaerolineae bacterium]